MVKVVALIQAPIEMALVGLSAPALGSVNARCYSARRAIMGSVREARWAGIQQASKAMAVISIALSQNHGSTVIAEVKCSQTLFDDIASLGGTAVMWKAGHSLIKAKMKYLTGLNWLLHIIIQMLNGTSIIFLSLNVQINN